MNEDGRNLIPFTPDMAKHYRSGAEKKLGMLYNPLRQLVKQYRRIYRRIVGDFGTEDQLKIACMVEPPMYFCLHGCMISHAYGITLSADEIGADCRIGQNVTVGTNSRTMHPGEGTKDKPSIGNLVSLNVGSVISGPVRIGNNVIVAAQAFVDKDVPDNHIVYGRNEVYPLQIHHWNYLKQMLWHCINVYPIIPGLVYIKGIMYIDETYKKQRTMLLEQP